MASPELYTVAGSYTFTCPPNVTQVTVECWGGGGNGTGDDNNNNGGHGGGGGAYAQSEVTVAPGSGYTVVVGGVAGDSSFGTTTVVAKGGASAVPAAGPGTGGQASASTGTIKYSGGNGAGGGGSGQDSGGGGGCAGPHGNGNNGSATTGGGSGDAGFGGAGGPDGGGTGGSNVNGGGGGGGSANDAQGGAAGSPGGGGGGGEADSGGGGVGKAGQVRITYTLPTVTTQAVSSVAATTATGNGNITAVGSTNPTERGVVYSTTSHSNPGNTSPASSSYEGVVTATGSFSTGAFTSSLTGLVSRTTYYARAYCKNTAGYTYGAEVSFTTIGFTNPGNVYASDNSYATLEAINGVLTVEISKDAGANWSAPLTKTFTGSDSLETYGNGSTELWGMALTRADMVDANFRVRLSQGNVSQVYKTFGFTTGSQTLTGVEIAVEAKYASFVLSIDLLKVKIYYGTSVLPIQAGSQAFASNGRKAGEGAGAGTGVLVFYDGNAWIACDTGVAVAA